MKWKPIETAPKDGTWIMAWRGTALLGEWSPLVIAQWSECEGIWVWPDEPYDVWSAAGREAANERMEDGGMFEDDKFTHWMPLPAPPQAATTARTSGDRP